MIKADELRSLLAYDPETGVFTWRSDVKAGKGMVRVKAGAIAGSARKDGYVGIRIAGRRYLAHRLAFLYMTGSMPRLKVDHRNCVRSDNRWINLRQATDAENGWNYTKPRHNTTGFKGVTFDKGSGRFQARIKVNNQLKWLGRFNCPTAAHFAYCRAAKAYFGEFARHE